ncbi:SRPBCC family protein [bacterium]|nr:SRPBCC family protein [bacterium]
MPGATTNVTVNTTVEKFYDVIRDFEACPDFIPDVKKIVIHSKDDKGAVVEYFLKMFGVSIEYTLKFEFEPYHTIRWSFIKGNKMKDNSGYWKLTPKGNNEVEAEYHAELKLGALIPSAVSDSLINVGLPKLMQQYKEYAESL